VGAALAREAAVLGVDVVLGPGVNIKRSPLCGRNFEYFSEDPHVSGAMGAALVTGIQSLGIGACVKHFAVNNQETDRMRVSADVDERTLREIYLPAFEHIVRQARPYALMCSYNRINGRYASENHWLLTQVLRQEWGFEGLVVSDWGAVNDRVAALAAGLDLEMPPTGTDHEIVTAVTDGRLDPETVRTAAGRVLTLAQRTEQPQRATAWDLDAHHELAREAALAAAVLLKNDGELLPIDPTVHQNLAVIGELARTPRYQAHGSSHVVPTRLDNAWDALQDAVGPDTHLAFAPGYLPDDQAEAPNARLRAEAVDVAARADAALLFLGLPESAESEGFDRTDLALPAQQVELLRAVAKACPKVVVVLANGGVVTVAEWQHQADAILETWLPGQAGGSAVADLLLGLHNPSGKLTETIPLRLEDTPSYLHFPGGDGHVVHGEGRYVGYRHYDTLDVPVAYPFGHGLSYTHFTYSDLDVRQSGDNQWTVDATVTNTGTRSGQEVVQLYVAFDEPHTTRPGHELRHFAKLALEPGSSDQVRFHVTGRDLAWWSTSRNGWRIDPGPFRIELGSSSRDIRLSAELDTPGDGQPDPLGPMSTLGEWLDHPVGHTILEPLLQQASGLTALAETSPVLFTLARGIPLAKFSTFGIGLTPKAVTRLVAAAADAGAAAAN
jgi:beta-glucosidase